MARCTWARSRSLAREHASSYHSPFTRQSPCSPSFAAAKSRGSDFRRPGSDEETQLGRLHPALAGSSPAQSARPAACVGTGLGQKTLPRQPSPSAHYRPEGLASLIRSARRWRQEKVGNQLRVALKDVNTRAVRGEYDLMFRLRERPCRPPASKLEVGRNGLLDRRRQVGRRAEGSFEEPSDPPRGVSYTPYQVTSLTSRQLRVMPQGSERFEFFASNAPMDHFQAEVRIDLSTKHPFEVFSLGPVGGQRMLTAKFLGVRSARFPNDEGIVGSGRCIDLHRSKIQILFLSGERDQPFPRSRSDLRESGSAQSRLGLPVPDLRTVYLEGRPSTVPDRGR